MRPRLNAGASSRNSEALLNLPRSILTVGPDTIYRVGTNEPAPMNLVPLLGPS